MEGRPQTGAARSEVDCECLREGPGKRGISAHVVGIDTTAGRFAEVKVVECSDCGRTWLVYRWEIEAISRSGRWYAGVVPRDVTARVTPEAAPDVLQRLPWHLCGGSYFGGETSRRTGPLLGL